MTRRSFGEFRSITEVIRARVSAAPARDAVRFLSEDGGGIVSRTISYSELDQRARALAQRLRQRHLPGSRVLLLYPTGIPFVVALLASVYAGFVAVPAPLPGRYQHQRQRLAAIGRSADASAVLTDLAHAEEVSQWARLTGQHLSPIATDTIEPTGLLQSGEWMETDVDRSRLMLLQYTSGSTGDPRGVMLTEENVLHNVASLQRCLGFSAETRFGGWIPLYHDMGLFTQLMPALLLGSTCVIMPPALFARRPLAWLRLITDHGVGCSAAPNFAYELCCQRITEAGLAGLNLAGWDIAINGSEPVNAATLRRFAARFGCVGMREAAIRPCYGLAEATVFVSGAPARPLTTSQRWTGDDDATGGAKEIVSCGVAVGHTVRIVDPGTSNPLGAREIGEIWIAGPNVAQGYFRNPAATRGTFNATTSPSVPTCVRHLDFA